jgi:hypothetical protein
MSILPLVTSFSGWQADSCEYASNLARSGEKNDRTGAAGRLGRLGVPGDRLLRLGSTYLAIRIGVNPVIAVLLGALILGEHLTTAMIAGGVLIVGAVVLVVRRSPPSH